MKRKVRIYNQGSQGLQNQNIDEVISDRNNMFKNYLSQNATQAIIQKELADVSKVALEQLMAGPPQMQNGGANDLSKQNFGYNPGMETTWYTEQLQNRNKQTTNNVNDFNTLMFNNSRIQREEPGWKFNVQAKEGYEDLFKQTFNTDKTKHKWQTDFEAFRPIYEKMQKAGEPTWYDKTKNQAEDYWNQMGDYYNKAATWFDGEPDENKETVLPAVKSNSQNNVNNQHYPWDPNWFYGQQYDPNYLDPRDPKRYSVEEDVKKSSKEDAVQKAENTLNKKETLTKEQTILPEKNNTQTTVNGNIEVDEDGNIITNNTTQPETTTENNTQQQFPVDANGRQYGLKVFDPVYRKSGPLGLWGKNQLKKAHMEFGWFDPNAPLDNVNNQQNVETSKTDNLSETSKTAWEIERDNRMRDEQLSQAPYMYQRGGDSLNVFQPPEQNNNVFAPGGQNDFFDFDFNRKSKSTSRDYADYMRMGAMGLLGIGNAMNRQPIDLHTNADDVFNVTPEGSFPTKGYNPFNPVGNNFVGNNTPVQFRGTAKCGGGYGCGGASYKEGGEYDLSEQEIQQILLNGGQIEYIK